MGSHVLYGFFVFVDNISNLKIFQIQLKFQMIVCLVDFGRLNCNLGLPYTQIFTKKNTFYGILKSSITVVLKPKMSLCQSKKLTLNLFSNSLWSIFSALPGFSCTSTRSIGPNLVNNTLTWLAGHHGGILHTIRVRPFGLSDCSTRVEWGLKLKIIKLLLN